MDPKEFTSTKWRLWLDYYKTPDFGSYGIVMIVGWLFWVWEGISGYIIEPFFYKKTDVDIHLAVWSGFTLSVNTYDIFMVLIS